jgi:hypothetical protein
MRTLTSIEYNIHTNSDYSLDPLSKNQQLDKELTERMFHLSGLLDVLNRCLYEKNPDEIGDNFMASVRSTIDLASCLSDSLIGAKSNLMDEVEKLSEWEN